MEFNNKVSGIFNIRKSKDHQKHIYIRHEHVGIICWIGHTGIKCKNFIIDGVDII